MLIPLFPQEGVMVVRVRPVPLGRQDLAVGIIPVVVGALALVLGQPRNAPPPVQVNPVGLALRPRREVQNGWPNTNRITKVVSAYGDNAFTIRSSISLRISSISFNVMFLNKATLRIDINSPY